MTIVAGTVLAVRLFYFHASEPNKHKYRLLRRLWPIGQRLEPLRILRSCNSEFATCGRPRHWIVRIIPIRLSSSFGFIRYGSVSLVQIEQPSSNESYDAAGQ